MERKTFVFTMKYDPGVPVEVRKLRPDAIAGLGIEDIKKLKTLIGGYETTLSELFEVEGPSTAPSNPDEIEIVIRGAGTYRIRFLGYRMKGGRIVVEGDIGPYAGYKMMGGEIIIKGSAASWLGAKMKNGVIEVYGDAGDFVGAKLMGEKPGKGMKNGTIVIHGNAGSNVGAGMKGGTIVIDGSAGNLLGVHMVGGSILVKGSVGRFAGARMRGGKIVVAGRIDGVLPSFYVDDVVASAKVKGIKIEKKFMVFVGDVLVNGCGRLFVSYEDNRDILAPFEELLRYEVEL